MANGGIRKIGDKYEVTFDFGKDETGKRIRRYKRFTSMRAAKKALSEHSHAIVTSSYVMPSDLTLSGWLDYWIENIIAPKCAYTSVYAYNNIINKYAKPELGNMPLQELQARDFQNYLTQLRTKYNLSSNTAIKHFDLLNHAMSTAYKQDYITQNPLNKVERPKKHIHEAQFYTPEELAELLHLVRGEQIELTVNLAAYFGLRRGEICGLQWKDVDFEKNQIHIRRTRTSAGSEIVEKDTKNRSSTRKLAMPETIRRLMEREKEYQRQRREELGDIYIDSDFIVVMDGGKPYRPNYLSQLFGEFLQRHGMRKIVLHELRHTFASLSNEAGIPEFNIGKALGHTTPSTTKKIYTHLFDPVHTSAINTVAGIVDNAVQTRGDEIDRINTIVPKIVNTWNPMRFEKDELDYQNEIDVIIKFLLGDEDKSKLGQFIYDTFRGSFGSRFFKCSLEECESIGRRMK